MANVRDPARAGATETARATPEGWWASVAAQLGPMVTLAAPVAVAELGWIAMGVVDTVMVGRLGPEAIGAVGLGNGLHMSVVIFGLGLLLGLDPLISRAFGAGDRAECHRWLVQGIYMAALLAPPLMLLVWAAPPWLATWGVPPSVMDKVTPYLNALNWSTPPLLVYSAFRRYSQAMDRVRPVMLALAVANAVNLAANAALIYGLAGFPALGVAGSGWSTTLARAAMLAILAGDAARSGLASGDGFWRVSLAPSLRRLLEMARLGLPAALHLVLEVGVFAAATALAGRMAPAALAAHEIVLNASCVTFMIPMGVSSAGAVRVGQALGRNDPTTAARAGWAALVVGSAFMACAGMTFLLAPRLIFGAFTDDTSVIAAGSGLLALAACFQLFDGAQVVCTGILRGAGDTRTPMVTNLVAHWLIGLPIGYLLAFRLGQGVFGLWVGLAAGLISAGVVLVFAWAARARRLTRDAGTA